MVLTCSLIDTTTERFPSKVAAADSSVPRVVAGVPVHGSTGRRVAEHGEAGALVPGPGGPEVPGRKWNCLAWTDLGEQLARHVGPHEPVQLGRGRVHPARGPGQRRVEHHADVVGGLAGLHLVAVQVGLDERRGGRQAGWLKPSGWLTYCARACS